IVFWLLIRKTWRLFDAVPWCQHPFTRKHWFMKLLRNVTVMTAALTLSAGVFALPAIAQDGQNVAERTAELDAADAPIQDEDRDYIATDGDDAAAVDALQEFADDAAEGELFDEQKPSETESPQTFDVEASQGQAVISELDIEEKMKGYRDAGKKVPLQETWMHRVYTHKTLTVQRTGSSVSRGLMPIPHQWTLKFHWR